MDELGLYSILVKDADPIAVRVEEVVDYYNEGWAVVKNIKAKNSAVALRLYYRSFNKFHEDDHLFRYVSDEVKNACNTEKKSSPAEKSSFVAPAIVAGMSAAAIAEADDDNFNSEVVEFNPATGLPMSGGIDAAGNPLGSSGSLSSTELFD